jgi:hypothetical protein
VNATAPAFEENIFEISLLTRLQAANESANPARLKITKEAEEQLTKLTLSKFPSLANHRRECLFVEEALKRVLSAICAGVEVERRDKP